MRIGEVATQSGVPIKTIRYHEEIGVLAPPARSPSGYREYDPDVIDRLRFVRASQSIGLSLGEIREIVAYRERGEVPCAHVLDQLVRRASRLRPEDCSVDSVCHLIPKTAARA